ncbi:hypothetical protein QQS21_002950 [Conoideocrella luteorostrata]|uniref:RRM domain-containing protein n=1 Tax=Conoideocrella luteorostrata TaxID=1105319 RepID=A0AAJ0CX72_9HYPO|nr:hypothetical protein QQS21_002950 [Conoideocrella luteorostrata]
MAHEPPTVEPPPRPKAPKRLISNPYRFSKPSEGDNWLTNVNVPTEPEAQAHNQLRSGQLVWGQAQGLRSVTNPNPVQRPSQAAQVSASADLSTQLSSSLVLHADHPGAASGTRDARTHRSVSNFVVPTSTAEPTGSTFVRPGGLYPPPSMGPSTLNHVNVPLRQRSMNDAMPPHHGHLAPVDRQNSIPAANLRHLGPMGSSYNTPVNEHHGDLQPQRVAVNTNPFIGFPSYNHQDGYIGFHGNAAPPGPPHLAGSIVQTGHQPDRFIPMLAVTRPDMTGKDFTPLSLGSKQVASYNFSPRYHGMHTESNASVEYLDANQNCALWLTNLPPNIRERELLGAIRKIGRVFATYINYPDGHKHSTSAAKIVFFTPEAAQKLLSQSTLIQPMVIRGFRVKVAHNRIKYGKNSMDNGESRVLIITGYEEFVNEQSLTQYFAARFQFQIDQVQTLIKHKKRAVVEYKFGSYRCQSQMGMKALLVDRPEGLQMVEYGADPCEVGSDMTSFRVAADRIQGLGLVDC